MITEQMVAEETARLAAYYDENPGQRHHDFANHRAFVEFALYQHRRLIEVWGGVRFTAAPYRSEYMDGELLNTIGSELMSGNQFYDLFYGWGNPSRPRMPNFRDKQVYALLRSKLFVPEPGFDGTVTLGDVEVEIRKGQSASRAVLKAVKKKYDKDHELVRFYDKLFEKLGHAWGQSNSLSVTFTVSPADVMELGHIDCEHGNSCYKAGGQTQQAKINICALEDSVTVYFHRGNAAELPWAERGPLAEAAGRAWGFITPDGTLFSNRYGLEWNTVAPAMTEAISAIFGHEVKHSQPTHSRYFYDDFNRSGGNSELAAFCSDNGAAVWKALMPRRSKFKYYEVQEAYLKAKPEVITVEQEEPALAMAG